MLPELERVPRLKLASTPTALQEAPRLAADMGLRRLLVKRDDNTGLAFGGNKARKLEYLVADAVGAGADVLLTVGGPQSNHCRSTAAAARQAGLEAQLVFNAPEVEAIQGNLLLDQLLGAGWTFAAPGQSPADRMAELAEELKAAGRRPYPIPSGGSNGLGALGYVRAALELDAQLTQRGDQPTRVVCAAGSCGTLAGLLISENRPLFGFREFGYRSETVISIGLDVATVVLLATFLALRMRSDSGQIGSAAPT